MKQNNRLLLIAAALCIAALIAMTAALSAPRKVVREPFTPPPFDVTAQQGVPEVSAELGWKDIDVTSFRFAACGALIPTDNSVDVWMTNYDSNGVWLKLRMLDENGNILGETGLIRPGEYVRSVQLTEIPAVGAAVTLKVMAYEPETYHSMGSVELATAIKEGTS